MALGPDGSEDSCRGDRWQQGFTPMGPDVDEDTPIRTDGYGGWRQPRARDTSQLGQMVTTISANGDTWDANGD